MADKALLVGINKYRNAPLSGCVNDVHDMAKFLVKRYKFRPDDIRIVVDERATTEGIKKRLWWLVDLRPGDRCFFHYSGHGTQFPTRDDKSELDGLLEVICPYDFAWDAQHMVTDKQFVKIFSRLKKGVKFAWVADCCHSGDLTRSIGNPHREMRSKFYPQPVDIAWRVEGLKARGVTQVDRGHQSKLRVGFVSGCQSNQTSADALFGKKWNGALTFFLLRNLRKMPLNTPMKRIVAATRQDLARHRYTQRPQAEGTLVGKPFLG